MTEQEALEELKTFPISCLDFKENQALGMAIKALEKSIAKKPTNIHKLLDTIGFCPNCKLRIYRMYAEEHYCHHCGQKLDWE